MKKYFKSNLFSNIVIHQRFLPFKNRFKYSFISLYLKYTELKKLDKEINFFSYNKFNLFSFYDVDHGYRDKRSLNMFVSDILSQNSIKYDKLNLNILCFPRILGYVFNPISVIFCFDNSCLIAILYEVKNTSNEQHTYCFASSNNSKKLVYKHKCKKKFYVSPFIQMNSFYKFYTKIPTKQLSLLIEQFNNKGEKILIASQVGKKIDFSSKIILKYFFKYPIMTIRIILLIHYQAIKIIFKGGKYYSRNKKPDDTFSYEGKI